MENEMKTIAGMMAVAARTAPKAKGEDYIELKVLSGGELASLKPVYLGLDCGACGFDTCAEMEANLKEGPEFRGPLCSWRLVDLGIALGSAVKTASLFNADNRIMYRIGVAALRAGMIKGEVAIGVPISATGKSIYFDR